MDNLTFYTAKRTNVFVWLTVLLSVGSAVTRIIYFSGAQESGLVVTIFRILLPIVANLFVAVRLPFRGQKMFYVTVNPVLNYGLYFAISAFGYLFDWWMVTLCVILCIVLSLVYFMTFTGRFKGKLIALAAFIIPGALYFIDKYLALFISYYGSYLKFLFISDAAIYLSIICMILAAKKLPSLKEGEERRRRYGDREDGRLVRSLSPITKVAPYIMVSRNDANNVVQDRVEVSAIQRYVREKRRQGYKHFGITHVIVAAYVRCCNDYPGINRFLAGQKIYARDDIQVNMIVKKEMNEESPDTAIKMHCKPTDTAIEIYEKFDELVQNVKSTELDSDFDNTAKIVDYIPGLVKKFGIWLVKVFDYFGIMPVELCEISPFHGSVFITSMGSLGIPPVIHHLYNFGNLPCFIAFGHKYTENELQLDGSVKSKKYIDFTFNTDERICDGFYYALVLKRIKSYFMHPEKLDEKPELKEDID